ncbi:kinase-like domain protein [Rutstroemia sp. NJR-2017a WRK4]|nr:kinase-like domain protein [Rutstroemia sp. NJR-2017a WRK4]
MEFVTSNSIRNQICCDFSRQPLLSWRLRNTSRKLSHSLPALYSFSTSASKLEPPRPLRRHTRSDLLQSAPLFPSPRCIMRSHTVGKRTYSWKGFVARPFQRDGRSLSDTSKASIFQQLQRMIEELRSVQCESPAVSNLEGGPIYDCRLPKTTFWGLFESIDDFIWHGPIHISVTTAVLSDVKEVVAFHESVKHPPVLTHGDLSSFNILVRDDEVVGIIDWETAGWLPYYWEYTTA